MFFLAVVCLGAVALLMRRNGALEAGASDAGVVLQRPRMPLEPSDADSLPHPRSFGAASKGADAERRDGASGDARMQTLPVRQEIATGGAAPLEGVKPATGFTLDGAPVRAGEQPLAREAGNANPATQLPRFSLDGEAAEESPPPRFGVDGEAANAGAPKTRFGVNGETADAAEPAAKPRFGANGEEASAATARFGVNGDVAAVDEQPRYGVNGEEHAGEAPRSTAVASVPVTSGKTPSRDGDSFGLDTDEPAVVAPTRTKASGILTATKALPADTLSPDDDPEPQHLLGEIHEKLSVRADERLARFDDVAANDVRSYRSSEAAGPQRLSSDADARGAAPESSRTGGTVVDPAVLWKPKEQPPTTTSASWMPQAEHEEPRSGLRAEEVDTDRHPFLDAADLLDGHPRRSEHEQVAGYKGKVIVERNRNRSRERSI